MLVRSASVIVTAVAIVMLGACRGGEAGRTLAPGPAASNSPSPSSPEPAALTPTFVATAGPAGSGSPQPTALASPGGAPAQVIRRGSVSRLAVSFTFDAGSDAGSTVQILSILRANGITAAFGVTGKWAEQNPDLLKNIADDGHLLINHSYSHPSFTGVSTGAAVLTQKDRWEQFDTTEGVVQRLTGKTTKPYFRPPYGDYDDSVNADAGARGYTYNLMWTVDSFGWKGVSAEEITQRCLELLAPGAIYIFHVGAASQDGAALQGIIDGIRAAGYSIESLPDLMRP